MNDLADKLEALLAQCGAGHAPGLVYSAEWAEVRQETKALSTELAIRGYAVVAERVDREYANVVDALRDAATREQKAGSRDGFMLQDTFKELVATLHALTRFAPQLKSFATQRPSRGPVVELCSWTQADLDNAIRQYKAERAASYADLCEAVRKNTAGARNKAKEIYGRNAIARALGVKAKAMVSKSPAWIAIAQDLEMPLNRTRRTQGTRHTRRPGKVGHEIAVEEKSAKPAEGADNAPADEQLETAERQATIRQINALASAGKSPKEKANNQKAADALIQKLQRGECTDDQARQVVEMALNPNG